MRTASLVLSILLLPSWACGGGGGGGSPSAPVRPRVDAAVHPSPITSRHCDCGPLVGELDFEAELVLTESGGAAARLERFRLVLRSDAGNRVVVELEVAVAPADGRIPAGGSLRRPFALHFPGANEAAPGTLEVTATLVDDSGTTSAAVASVRVLPPPA
jgi:hypothetical protein